MQFLKSDDLNIEQVNETVHIWLSKEVKLTLTEVEFIKLRSKIGQHMTLSEELEFEDAFTTMNRGEL